MIFSQDGPSGFISCRLRPFEGEKPSRSSNQVYMSWSFPSGETHSKWWFHSARHFVSIVWGFPEHRRRSEDASLMGAPFCLTSHRLIHRYTQNMGLSISLTQNGNLWKSIIRIVYFCVGTQVIHDMCTNTCYLCTNIGSIPGCLFAAPLKWQICSYI